MNRILLALAATLVSIVTFLSPAQAVELCASNSERASVFIGDRMREVHVIFNHSGEWQGASVSGDYRYEHRRYTACEPPAGTGGVFLYTYRKHVDGGYWRLYLK